MASVGFHLWSRDVQLFEVRTSVVGGAGGFFGRMSALDRLMVRYLSVFSKSVA